MEEMTGYSSVEVLGKHPKELFPFLRRYGFDAPFERALAGETVVSPDMFYDGGRRGGKAWTVARWGPLRETGGAVVNDITEGKGRERQLLDISEREQRRIGQDLHDDLSQRLTGTVFLISSLRERLAAKALPEAADAKRVGEALAETQTCLRQVARGLQPVMAAPEGLMIALRHLAKPISEQSRIVCCFACPRRVLVRDNKTATHLFRIAQEAVNNAVRHRGRPTNVTVTLRKGKGTLVLTVRDDGTGMRPVRGRAAGMGLRIMQSRTDSLNGRIELRSVKPRGTVLQCIVPVPASEKRKK